MFLNVFQGLGSLSYQTDIVKKEYVNGYNDEIAFLTVCYL